VRAVKVGLIDFDGKIPNLALMKLSTYYKQQGAEIFLNDVPKDADKVFCSVLFTWNRTKAEKLKNMYENIEFGGTGWNLHKQLSQEIENCKPDYELYQVEDVYKRIGGIMKKETRQKKAETIANMGIGFTSRGCVRNCEFCFVPPKEGKFHQVAEIKDIINPKSNVITLLDNNLSADPNCIEKLQEIRDRKLIVDISQGIDVRLLTEEKAKAFSEIKHLRSIHYAWDLMNFEKSVMDGIKLLSKHVKTWRHVCFMLVGYNTLFEEDMYRFKKLHELGISPYVMIYNKQGDARLKHFARWVNGRFHKACKWDEYEPWIKAKQQCYGQIKMAL
jgi:hypothetical protein